MGQSGGSTASATAPCQLSVDFGQLQVGTQSSAVFNLSNPGNAPLTFATLQGTVDPAFSVELAPQPLPPNGSGTLTVVYAPTAAGSNSSSVSFPTDPYQEVIGPPVLLQITGAAFAAILTVDAGAIDFGSVVVNATQTRAVTLTNGSSGALDGITFKVTGESEVFSATGVPTSLAAGASASVAVTYAPAAPEPLSQGALVISTGGTSTTIDLSGSAISNALMLTPATLDFGFVPPKSSLVGCTSVLNQSAAAIHLTGVNNFNDANGAFAVSTTDDQTPPNPITFPLAIAGGQSAKVCFSFTPPLTQQYAGQVTLTNDGQGDPPVVVLTGWGGGPQISCTPSPLDFGDIILGSSLTLPVTCTNNGTPIASTNLILGQPTANPSGFSVQFDPAHPYSATGIAAGSSVVLDVTFAPGNDSLSHGTLLIPNNGGQGTTLQIPLTSTVFDTACTFQISPPALEFGNPPLSHAPTVLGFEIQNTGTVPCQISVPTIEGSGAAGYRVSSLSVAPDSQTQIITLAPVGAGGPTTLDVGVTFQPPTTALFFAQANFSVLNAATPAQSVSLSASSQSSCLVLAPSTLDFGTVAFANGVSCASAPSQSFTVFNQCTAQNATVQSVTLQAGPGDATVQFTTPQGNSTPTGLPGGEEIDYSLALAATSSGPHIGQVLVSDGTVTSVVFLTANALDAVSQTDNFVTAAPKVDVLFQMDTSAQPNASTMAALFDGGLAAFVQAGSQVDYRIAVTTDDDDASNGPADMGRLLPCGNCSVVGTQPEIISASTTLDGGASADPAMALAKLLAAISVRESEPDLFASLLLTLQSAPLAGVDFFRPGAELVVVVLSGQDDNSALPVSWYAMFFEDLWGPASPLTWNYISAGIVDGSGLLKSTDEPPRIRQVISATAGLGLNASDPAWVGALSTLWPSAPVSRYPLSAIPVTGQAGIAVSQNGTSVPQSGSGGPNWTYDSVSNAVTFTSSQPVAAGDQIAITYAIGCQ